MTWNRSGSTNASNWKPNVPLLRTRSYTVVVTPGPPLVWVLHGVAPAGGDGVGDGDGIGDADGVGDGTGRSFGSFWTLRSLRLPGATIPAESPCVGPWKCCSVVVMPSNPASRSPAERFTGKSVHSVSTLPRPVTTPRPACGSIGQPANAVAGEQSAWQA